MDFKLIALDVDFSKIHQLFDSCQNTPPIDSTVDILFGAFDGERLVAATSATPTSYNQKRVLWSNFLIVDPEYRRQRIGFELKQFERSWAIGHRYASIMWAFDPFDVSLARFYFHTLGAIANGLRLNLDVEINKGTSYNLEVVWRLKARQKKASQAQKRVSNSYETTPFALEVGEKGQPIIQIDLDPEVNGACRVEIPFSTYILQQAYTGMCDEWHQAIKESLEQAFLKKYVIADFEIENGRCWYVLTAPMPWFLYVVECSDNTLYTGITPDLSRRLKLHNAGRGAAYTATRTPVRFVATWKFGDRIDAMHAEIAFKRLSRERKLQHINGGLDFCGNQFHLPHS